MSRLWGERVAALGCIVIALYMGWIALDFPAGGDAFPLFTVVSVVVIGIVMIATTLLKPDLFPGDISFDVSFARLKPMIVAALAVAYVLLIFRLGYYAATVAFFVATTLLIGIRSVRLIAPTAAALLAALYLFFELVLSADLPRGLLF